MPAITELPIFTLDTANPLHSILSEEIGETGLSLYTDVYDFYKRALAGVGSTDFPVLAVLMARKAWCLKNAYWPLLLEEGAVQESEYITHDKMLTLWFNSYKGDRTNLKVHVIDDNFLTGRAVDDCICRLVDCYGIEPSNISLFIYDMWQDERMDNKKLRLSENNGGIDGPTYKVKNVEKNNDFFIHWKGNQFTLRPEENIRSNSMKFVESIHACEVPYVVYAPSFFLSTKDAEKLFVMPSIENRESAYIQQNELMGGVFMDDKKFEYHNITTQQMYLNRIDSFSVSPKDESGILFNDWMPDYSNALSFLSLRVYVFNRSDRVIITPYASLKECKASADLVSKFPKKIRHLFIESPMNSRKDTESQISAHRMLRYILCYVWGKEIIKKLDIRGVDYTQTHKLCGIYAEELIEWINDNSITSDLKEIWSFFESPENRPTAISFEDSEMFEAAFNISFDERVKGEEGLPDPYAESLILFRNLFEAERNEATQDSPYRPKPFQGVPLKTFSELLVGEPYCYTKNMVAATIFYLGDIGTAVTYVHQRGDTIGTYIVNGEEAYHSFYNICSSYAFFLSELINNIKTETISQSKKVASFINELPEIIKGYFREETDNGYYFGPIKKALFTPIETIERERSNISMLTPHCAQNHIQQRDPSLWFFISLLDEYRQLRGE